MVQDFPRGPDHGPWAVGAHPCFTFYPLPYAREAILLFLWKTMTLCLAFVRDAVLVA